MAPCFQAYSTEIIILLFCYVVAYFNPLDDFIFDLIFNTATLVVMHYFPLSTPTVAR